MATLNLNCPQCDKVLKLPFIPITGRAMLCPQCNQRFQFDPSLIHKDESATKPPVRRPAASRPPATVSATRRSQPSHRAYTVGGVVALGLLIVAFAFWPRTNAAVPKPVEGTSDIGKNSVAITVPPVFAHTAPEVAPKAFVDQPRLVDKPAPFVPPPEPDALPRSSREATSDRQLELVLQTGHSKWINAVAISPDGRYAITGAQDHLAIVWDRSTGQMLQTLRGHTAPIQAVALSSDGRHALTGSDNSSALLWDIATGKAEQAFTSPSEFDKTVNAVAMTVQGQRILTTDGLWDRNTGKLIRRFGFSKAMSADGKIVLTNSPGDGVILWDALSGNQLHTLRLTDWVRTDMVRVVSLSADGKIALTGSKGDKDNTAILWNVQTGKPLHTLGEHNASVSAASLSADGKIALTGSARDGAILWNALTGERLRTLKSGEGSRIQHAPLSEDGRFALTGYLTGGAIMWNTSTGQEVMSFRGRTKSVDSVAVSGDSQHVLTGQFFGLLWDVASGRAPRRLNPIEVLDPTDFCENTQSALSADGGKVLIGLAKETAYLSRIADIMSGSLLSGQRLEVIDKQFKTGNSMALSADGSRAATITFMDSEDGEGKRLGAAVWGNSTKKPLYLLDASARNVNSVAISGDGRIVLAGSWYDAILWDGTTGRILKTLTDPDERRASTKLTSVALSRDGRRALAGTSNGTAILWDTTSGLKLHTLTGDHQEVTFLDEKATTVAMSSDGRRAITASSGSAAILWDATTGKKLHSLRGHSAPINSVTLTADGKHSMTASEDGTVRLWDSNTGEELCKLVSIDKGEDWLVVTPDGLFDGSIDAAKAVSYRIRGTLEFVPLERFQQKYYQPGLLAMLMKGERPRAKVDIGKSLPPKVRITSPTGAGLNAQNGTIEVQAVAETRGEQPVSSFKLLLDGRPYGGQNAVFRVVQPKTGTVTARWSVELEPGKHTLKVMADTTYVQGASDEIEVRYVGGQSDTKVELPSLYVLAIGVSKYPGTRKLDYAAADAQALAEAYRQHSRPLFQSMEVKQITDEQATRKGIFDGLLWLREKMNQKSVGVVFFAGHGEKDQDGSLYFLPIDFEEKNLAGSALDADSLKKQLAGIPGRLTLILDACHSGEIGSGKTRGTGSLTDGLIRDLTAEENGLIVMCSTLGSEQAQESHAHRHGMFTVALLEGLSGQAKKTTDGAVYLTALDAYVVERVRELSKGQQHPVTSKPTTVRDIPVSKP